MRAASPPGFCVGIAARRLRDPGEELPCQFVRGALHGGEIYPLQRNSNRSFGKAGFGLPFAKRSRSGTSVRVTGRLVVAGAAHCRIGYSLDGRWLLALPHWWPME